MQAKNIGSEKFYAAAKKHGIQPTDDNLNTMVGLVNAGVSVDRAAMLVSRNVDSRGLLSPEDEMKFQRDMQFAPGWRDWRRDFIEGVGKEPNLEPGGDYNYRLAWQLGATPQYHEPSDSFHGLSSAMQPPYAEPQNLKAPNHPTMWKEHFMRQYGFDPDQKDAPWTQESLEYAMKKTGHLK